jgi:hypothetical protein
MDPFDRTTRNRGRTSQQANPGSSNNQIISNWFMVARLAQLLAMTFVAAQKVWDGVLLFAILVVDAGFGLGQSGTNLAAQ